MCGRYVQTRSPGELARAYAGLDTLAREWRPSWNVAPTQSVLIVLERSGETGERQRRVEAAKWGLVPSWAKDRAIGSRMINARSETVTTKPAFRHAARRQRAVVPADGYFEWAKLEGGKKQPYFLRSADGEPLSFAGLWEAWRDPAEPEESGKAWLVTCTILTTTATDATGWVHDRSPVILTGDHLEAWLDPGMTEREEVEALLRALPEPHLVPRPVSSEVGNVRNNRPELVAPLEEEPGQPPQA